MCASRSFYPVFVFLDLLLRTDVTGCRLKDETSERDLEVVINILKVCCNSKLWVRIRHNITALQGEVKTAALCEKVATTRPGQCVGCMYYVGLLLVAAKSGDVFPARRS